MYRCKMEVSVKKKQICEGFVEYVDFPNKAVVTTKETDADGKEKEYKVNDYENSHYRSCRLHRFGSCT